MGLYSGEEGAVIIGGNFLSKIWDLGACHDQYRKEWEFLYGNFRRIEFVLRSIIEVSLLAGYHPPP